MYRRGRHRLFALYAQRGTQASDSDAYLGELDSPAAALAAVNALNGRTSPALGWVAVDRLVYPGMTATLEGHIGRFRSAEVARRVVEAVNRSGS